MCWRFCALFALLISASGSEQVVVRETRAQCGNGQVEVDEDCDDGNDISGDACTTGCTIARCGDGTTRTDLALGEEGHEACDDGNALSTDGCLATCRLPACGDGFLRNDLDPSDPNYEQCDDGNNINTDDCTNQCDSPACGVLPSAPAAGDPYERLGGNG